MDFDTNPVIGIKLSGGLEIIGTKKLISMRTTGKFDYANLIHVETTKVRVMTLVRKNLSGQEVVDISVPYITFAPDSLCIFRSNEIQCLFVPDPAVSAKYLKQFTDSLT